MSYSDLIQIYFERSNALQGLWTLYVVVIGGLLAFSSLRKQPALLTTILVTIRYLSFAYKNLGGIHDITQHRFAILEVLKQSAPTGTAAADAQKLCEILEPTLVPPPYDGVRNFHIVCDVLTVAALWAMELRRKKNAAAKP